MCCSVTSSSGADSSEFMDSVACDGEMLKTGVV